MSDAADFYSGPAEGPAGLLTAEAVAAQLDWFYRHALDAFDAAPGSIDERLVWRATLGGVEAIEGGDEFVALDALLEPYVGAADGVARFARRALVEAPACYWVRSAADARFVDRFVDFCITNLLARPHGGRADLVELGSVPLRWYDAAAGLLKGEALRLWNYVLAGRGVGRPADRWPYRSHDGAFHVGFWTAAEALFLRDELGRSFAL
jgi:hypothetical protein